MVIKLQDYIMASDEFLIKYSELVERKKQLYGLYSEPDGGVENDEQNVSGASAENKDEATKIKETLARQDTTAIQVINEIILEAKKIHDDIYRRRKTEARKRMMDISKQIATRYRKKQGVTAETARVMK